MLPCLIAEEEHFLVVNKPAGMNTHSPAPFAGEGLYDWLRHREPRWADLAIIHRLDKETSGLIVFGKTPLGNRSLTGQFTRRGVQKTYRLLTDREPPKKDFKVESVISRVGNKYLGKSSGPGEPALTRFVVIGQDPSGRFIVEATPLTGRTHQIRVHAAAEGFPILGDPLYGGTPWQRLCLHARELTFLDPQLGTERKFHVPEDFAADPRLTLRSALLDPQETNARRLLHGAADGWPGWYVDQLGEFLLSQSEAPLDATREQELLQLMKSSATRGAYHKLLTRQLRRADLAEASPKLVLGDAAPDQFAIRENGLAFEMSFAEGSSSGLFLDQRDNRRRVLTNHVAADFPLFPNGAKDADILNVFAYTCGFSVCAARAGARATSLDLSRKYLDWGRRNFTLNQLDPAAHEFIYGDAFDWLRRLAKKQRAFDLVILDPPTFSQSKEHGAFRAEKDFGKLVAAALPALKPNGVLFASTNATRLSPEEFLEQTHASIKAAGREISQQHYVPQPPDFPITREEPAHLKTVWLRVA